MGYNIGVIAFLAAWLGVVAGPAAVLSPQGGTSIAPRAAMGCPAAFDGQAPVLAAAPLRESRTPGSALPSLRLPRPTDASTGLNRPSAVFLRSRLDPLGLGPSPPAA